MTRIFAKSLPNCASMVALGLTLSACGHHHGDGPQTMAAPAAQATTQASVQAPAQAGTSVTVVTTQAAAPSSTPGNGPLQTTSDSSGKLVGTVLHAAGSTVVGTGTVLDKTTASLPIVNGVVQTATDVTHPLGTSLKQNGTAIRNGSLSATPVAGPAVGAATVSGDNGIGQVTRSSGASGGGLGGVVGGGAVGLPVNGLLQNVNATLGGLTGTHR